MAEKTISNLNQIEEAAVGDLLAIDDISAGETKKLQIESLMGDNALINQDFSIWQENTTFTNPADVYTADGYYVQSNAAGGTLPTINIKKNIVNMEAGFEQCCELEITNVGSFSGGYWRINQDAEDYKKYAGKAVTFSMRMKTSVAMTIGTTRLYLYDGVSYSSANITITTSFVTFKLNKTMHDSASELRIFFHAGESLSTTGSIYIQWMKLGLGSAVTPSIPPKKEESLDDAQRQYQKTYAQGVFPGAVTDVGAVWHEITAVASADHTITIDVKFPKVMKAAPTVTLYDLVGNSGKVTMAAGNNITGTVSQISDSGFEISATNGAAATSRKLAFHYTAISRM